MATIKSYTDLEQSKKLAEILPLKSADMNYSNVCAKGVMYSNSYSAGLSSYNNASKMNQENIDFYLKGVDYKGIIAWKILPCWSLAALLDVLPKNLNIGRPSLESNYKGYYWIQYYDEYMKPSNYKTECFNNPVDACYEMIIHLNELKML